MSGRRIDASHALKVLDNLAIAHPKIKDAVGQVLRMCMPGSGTQIVLVVAPPGWGKSYMSQILRQKLLEQSAELLQSEPHAKPVLLVETPEAGERSFSWGLLYRRIRIEAQEPPLGRVAPPAMPWQASAPPDAQRTSVARLRDSAGRTLRERKTRLLMLDEAAHMLVARSPETLHRNAMTLKSLANDTGTVLLLICSYDGLPLMEIEPQLTRRMQLLHLARYDSENAEERQQFTNIVLTVGRALELDDGELLSRMDEFMVRTNGCPGAVVTTFRQAICESSRDGVFRYSYLDRFMPSAALAARIRSDALAAQSKIRELS